MCKQSRLVTAQSSSASFADEEHIRMARCSGRMHDEVIMVKRAAPTGLMTTLRM